MAKYSVSFWLEASSLDAAKTAVGQWVVTPDTTLIGISETTSTEGEPIEIPDGGTIADVTKAAGQ